MHECGFPEHILHRRMLKQSPSQLWNQGRWLTLSVIFSLQHLIVGKQWTNLLYIQPTFEKYSILFVLQCRRCHSQKYPQFVHIALIPNGLPKHWLEGELKFRSLLVLMLYCAIEVIFGGCKEGYFERFVAGGILYIARPSWHIVY